jgi:hypothetical protein
MKTKTKAKLGEDCGGERIKKSERKVKSKKEIKSRTTAHAEPTKSIRDTHQYPRRAS